MPALVRLSVLCALLLFQVTMAYLPAHLQVRRQVVPYGAPNEDDHGPLVQDMQEKITVVDPDDSFPTKKPTKKQFFRRSYSSCHQGEHVGCERRSSWRQGYERNQPSAQYGLEPRSKTVDLILL
ncbi:hypothetical protein LEN26_012038 [Aphanomyces euteiches]|nr:hypothetical protein LEN26_012038 [Aphanomyces euteiches]